MPDSLTESQKAKEYWANESEAFARVMDAMEKGTAKLGIFSKGVYNSDGEDAWFGITAGGHPGYDTLFLEATGQPGVYSFSTYNQVAGGQIQGVIAADPQTGKYAPIQDYTKQVAYTPGQSGGWLQNTLNQAGPFGNVILALATGGLSIPEQIASQVALNTAKGQDLEDALKGAITALATKSALNGLGVPETVAENTGSNIAGQVVSNTLGNLVAGQDLTTALINAGINQVAGNIANQTPADFANDVNTVLDSTAGVPVSAYEPDINQVLDMPATQPNVFPDTTAPELPSGMDLSSDVIPGTANTVEDVSQALAGEGTAISGQDLAADATPGNTLADVSAVLTPTVTPAPVEEPGLNKDQIAQILKTGLGLFGGITAASKALQGLQRTPTSTVAPTASITPFTGTYSGMNPYDAAYYQQVQQNYNRLFPTTPANVATPLESWYSTQYKPETSVINSLFSPLLK